MAAIKLLVDMLDGTTFTAIEVSIAAEDVPRVIAAHAAKYRKPDDEGAEWVLKKWGEEFVVDGLNYTKNFEAQQAASAAASQVTLIPVTIS